MLYIIIHIIVVIYVFILPQFASAGQCAAKVYFGNGIASPERDVRKTRDILRKVINQALASAGRQQLPFDCFDYAYATDSSVPYLGDLIESTSQIVLDDYSTFWQWLAGRGSDPPNIFEQAVQAMFASVSDIEYAVSVDLQNQVQRYRTTIDREQTRVVVIAHSQGNLFANQAFAALSTGTDGFVPISPERFRITAVATPQSFVATGDDWTTLYGDIILAVPGRLPANTDTDGTDCHSIIPQLPGLHPIACHLFDSSYFVDSSVYSRARIISEVLSQIPEGSPPTTRYTFTKIADSTESFVDFGMGPNAINTQGTVAFGACVGTMLQTCEHVILTGNGGPLTVIASRDGLGGSVVLDFDAAINTQGVVAFRAVSVEDFSGKIFTSSDGLLTDISGPFNGTGGFSLNSVGEVAFALPNGEGLLINRSDVITTLYDIVSSPFSTMTGSCLALNTQGTVAFGASLKTGDFGIFTGNGGLITTVVTIGDLFHTTSCPALNDEGDVAFLGGSDLAVDGVFLKKSDVISTITDISGPFSGFLSFSLNGMGIVAFHATLKEGGEGIFTGPDPIVHKVIRTGDRLFGSTVASIWHSWSSVAINDIGQIVFLAVLADGTLGVYRADPVP